MNKNNYKNDTKNIIAGKRKKLSNGFVNSPIYKGSTVLFNTVEEMQSKMKKKNSQTLFYGRFGALLHLNLKMQLPILMNLIPL